MNYMSLVFYAFICIFLIIYYMIPQKYRYIVVAVGSYIFYGYANIRMLIALLAITIFTYIGGLLIEKKKSKAIYVLFFALSILVLMGFKYTNFIIHNINWIASKTTLNIGPLSQIDILVPIGLSFIIFQTCTYLGDVYKKNIAAEKNIVMYAAFVAFFPTVLSGPIQKARELLPQIKTPEAFDAEQAKKGTILFIWGLFEKAMVANKLLIIVNMVFDDYTSYNSAYYIVAGICFSLYIYADFSSYSDMARGISMIMGIKICKNFNNPYLSKTTSEFWNRWHMSLNSWFVEYIYIPLGGNRKGKIRKYINIFIVFLISGIWHGANYHFIVWGILNGILVIIGQITKSLKQKIYRFVHVSEEVESVVFCKKIIVFWLITLTWIFFNNGVYESVYIVKNMILFNPINFFDQNLLSITGTTATTFMTLLSTIFFAVIQIKRQNERMEYIKYLKQPFVFQVMVMACLICVCIFAICSTEADVNSQFLYFQF